MDHKIPFIAWKGVLRAVDPHLVDSAHLYKAENIESTQGAIRTRQGCEVVRRSGATQAGLWPVAIFTREAPVLQWPSGADFLANSAIMADKFLGAVAPQQLREANEADATSVATYLEFADDLPDWTELGGRVFFGDGINPNMALGATRSAIRPMGVMPQSSSPTLTPAYDQNGNLTPGAQYTYGIQRIVTVGRLELASSVILNTVQLTQTVENYKIVCAAVTKTTVADWAAIKSGWFKLTAGGTGYAIGPIDLSDVTDFAGIAERIQVMIRVASTNLGLATVSWATDHFEIESSLILAALASATGHTASPDSDLSGSGWINGQAATISQPDNTAPSVTVTIEQYPYSNPAWSVTYRIFRSQESNGDFLYRVADLTSFPEGGTYIDKKSDDEIELDLYTFDAASDDLNSQVPPVRYLRAWNGSLVCGGSARYSRGSLSTVDNNTVVTVAAPGTVRVSDVGALIQIDGESESFLIVSVDLNNSRLTLDRACDLTQAAARYVICRDNDVVYVTNPLPGNIEGYTNGTEVFSTSGNPIRGIAVSCGYCYILRETRVDILEAGSNDYQLATIPGAPGCPSHATIADRYSPVVIYYAGREGVWVLSGDTPQNLSAAIDGLIRTEIDHGMDQYSHAVYDPVSGWYRLWVFELGWSGPAIPQLCLCFDTRRKDWYVFRQYAVSSGLWKDAGGSLVPVIGVPGAVCRLDRNSFDGVNLAGVITGATASSITNSNASFPALAGLPIHITKADGTMQRRLIRSNTSTSITIFGSFDQTPSAGDLYHVGAISWFAETGELSLFGSSDAVDLGVKKQFTRLFALFEPDTQANPVSIQVKGVRSFGNSVKTETVDLNNREDVELEGNKLGLRARSVVAKISGNGARPVTLLGLQVEAKDVSK